MPCRNVCSYAGTQVDPTTLCYARLWHAALRCNHAFGPESTSSQSIWRRRRRIKKRRRDSGSPFPICPPWAMSVSRSMSLASFAAPREAADVHFGAALFLTATLSSRFSFADVPSRDSYTSFGHSLTLLPNFPTPRRFSFSLIIS